MTVTKQLLKVALTHVPLKVVLKLLQLFVETMVTIIHIHGRHWIPHHNKRSDNELDSIIHVVHQRRLSMNEDQTWLHFMNTSCMALRKYRMETRHWGACPVLPEVPRAGDSVLNLISACQSDDWEGILCCIRDIIKYLFAQYLPQPPTPSTSYTPVTTITLQPHILHNHPHPITIHIPQPPTSLQPHTTQSHTHSKTTHTPKPPPPTQLPTPINHTA